MYKNMAGGIINIPFVNYKNFIRSMRYSRESIWEIAFPIHACNRNKVVKMMRKTYVELLETFLWV